MHAVIGMVSSVSVQLSDLDRASRDRGLESLEEDLNSPIPWLFRSRRIIPTIDSDGN